MCAYCVAAWILCSRHRNESLVETSDSTWMEELLITIWVPRVLIPPYLVTLTRPWSRRIGLPETLGKVHSMHWSLRACCGIRCVENVCYVHRCAMNEGQVRCCCVHFGTFVWRVNVSSFGWMFRWTFASGNEDSAERSFESGGVCEGHDSHDLVIN